MILQLRTAPGSFGCHAPGPSKGVLGGWELVETVGIQRCMSYKWCKLLQHILQGVL